MAQSFPRAVDGHSMIAEMNVGIQAVSLTDGAFGAVISAGSSPSLSREHYHANAREEEIQCKVTRKKTP